MNILVLKDDKPGHYNQTEGLLIYLKEIFEAVNSDIYDVLAHLSFNLDIKTRNETYIIVVAEKISGVVLKAQQSDYQHVWDKSQSTQAKPHKPGRLMALQEFFQFSPSAVKIIVAVNNLLATNGSKKLCSNRHLSKHKLDEI